MKILHLCLSNYYIDGYGYQENYLPYFNKEDGHQVKIIASTETFIDNNHLGYLEPAVYQTEGGISIERLAYKKYLPHKIMTKIRSYQNLYERMEDFKPDVILCHGMAMKDMKSSSATRRLILPSTST